MTDTHNHRRLALVAATLALLALVAFAGPAAAAKDKDNGGDAAGGSGNGNTGTIKVHDEATASPPKRNEPHVDCEDFWVEGFKMAAGSGTLTFFSWPPTGDKAVVKTANWTSDGAAPKEHFLAGPFTLAAGHYRVEASNAPDHAKTKMFWVDGCEQPPSCGGEGQPPCCSGEDTPPCPTCGTEDTPPCMVCPTDLAAVANDDGSVTLTWTPAPGSDGSNVYRAAGGGDLDYVATVDAGVGTYTDSTTAAGQGYAYTVTGLFGDSESQDCPIVEATAIPDFPTTLGLGLATTGGILAMVLARRRKA